jgi:predicted transcriptional regulator YdeE
MQQIMWSGKQIQGFSVRTNNANELNAGSAKIAALCQRFDTQVAVNYAAGARVYIAYYAYASDYQGDFSVLVGTDQMDVNSTQTLDKLQLPAGKYLKFCATGAVPQIVIETWQTIWAYFADPACPQQRAYQLDFEFYTGPHDIEIYIGLV